MFHDRVDAGKKLAHALRKYAGHDAVVVGLPRGGVPVAREVSRALSLPLDVWIVRKVGAPGYSEYGVGAVAEGGVLFLDAQIMRALHIDAADVADTIARERGEIERRRALWRKDRPAEDITGKTVIVVDDGIATGGTVRAAIEALRAHGPRKLVLAVPVAPVSTLRELEAVVDEAVCLTPVVHLGAVGAWYDDFTQVPDETVARMLAEARALASQRAGIEGVSDLWN